MALSRAEENKLLTEAERALVAPSHHPELAGLDAAALAALRERLTAEHDRLRGLAAAMNRAKRAKGDVREAAGGEANVAARKQILAAALKRVAKRAG
jgi:hypothetical protein